ncbi:FUSC family protein [Fundidesulfovibrio terrae]|uniref:FUSC family protein n=1 Tax=Fundidesulfovibrio terrae TaxID=2922866 RepID=UPI001FAF2231|nr:FUSC family protein [Fundidesulfovibrio terrae]
MKLPKPSPVHLKHALKTALAAVCTYALTVLFHLPQGYWAVISVIIVMQNNLGSSYQVGVNRIIGTAVGAVMGAACMSLLGPGAMALGVGVGLTILICAYFIHLHESFRMAGLTATIIILLSNQNETFMEYAVFRFLEISLGVTVSLAFSAFIWPSRAGRQFKLGVVKALHDEAAYYSILLACRISPDCDMHEEAATRKQLEATREANHALLEEAKKEPAGLSKQDHISVSLFNFTERIAEHMLSMESAVHHDDLESLHGMVAKEMDMLAQTTITAMTRLALAVSQDRDPGPMDDLKRAVAAAEDGLSRIRKQHVLPTYDLEPVMRFFSYYYNMREVAVELTGMAERATLLAGE